jgi:hypothetical protein
MINLTIRFLPFLFAPTTLLVKKIAQISRGEHCTCSEKGVARENSGNLKQFDFTTPWVRTAEL